MANIIHVSPEKLTQSASRFEQTAGEVKSCTSSMTSTVQSLSGRVWSGEAANAYKNKFNSLQGDINKLYNMITTHSNHLKQIANEYKTKETENIGESSNLSSSVIA